MLVHEKSNSLLVNVNDPAVVAEQMPKHKLLDHPQFNLAVPFNVAHVRRLWKQGYAPPSPIMRGYTFPGKYKPFDHQRKMCDFLTTHNRCFNLSEMGTGKSAGSLWSVDALMNAGRVNKALVLAPLSTLKRVWANDIFDVLMHRTCTIVHGSRDKRLAELEKDVDFYIMNHEGVTIDPVNEAIRRNPDINLIILDEGSMFRNYNTKKYKSLIKLLRDDMRLWWLTGTPCPNAPTDAWAQAKAISPNRVPKYFGGFRRATMMQVSQFKWTPKQDAYRTAYDALQPAIRFKKEDCLDLPPVVSMDREAGMTKEQADFFKDMRKAMQIEAKDTEITAVNAADKINKLRQILCGSIKSEDGDYVSIDYKKRLDVLLETIESASAKVLVICPFKGAIWRLKEDVSKHYSAEVINGDVPARKRDDIILRFKTTKDPHVLLCHPKVMSHGLNLVEADMLIFFAPIYSNDEYAQVVERFNRTGQTRKMTVVRMGAHPVEWAIYKMIDERRTNQESILSLYRSVIA